MKKILLLATVLVLMPASAWALNTFDFSVALFDLGGDVYRYELTLTNMGPDRDAIFKWTLNNGLIASDWIGYDLGYGGALGAHGYELPQGWEAVLNGPNGHPDHRLEFQTANGDITSGNPGYFRLYGQDPPNPPNVNGTWGVFKWTFYNDGGPMPTADRFMPYSNTNTVKVHFQPIGERWQNLGDTYVGTYVPEPATLFLLGSGLLGLAGFRRFRHKK